MLAADSGSVNADDALIVGLHNNTTEDVQTCSEVPDLTTPAWHFVAPGGTILDIISLTVGRGTYTNPEILQYPSGQYAYVEVRDGDEIEDLTAGVFLITGTDKVVLSHVCTGTPPTTTTTTTTEKATTTTGKATTTSDYPTTTASVSVSTAVAAGPTTAPPTTLAALATQLPATGGSSR